MSVLPLSTSNKLFFCFGLWEPSLTYYSSASEELLGEGEKVVLLANAARYASGISLKPNQTFASGRLSAKCSVCRSQPWF